MRRIERAELQAETAEELRRLQAEADQLQAINNLQSTNHWERHRRSNQAVLAVLTALQQMAGNRLRCMYCVDSLGSDIEHFRPKANFPELMYAWKNLLLNCTPCGRKKGNRFPVTANGQPLLIDPSAEDPWSFLDFDPDTGNLSARYLIAVGAFAAKGEETVKVLELDRREGVSEGYRKTYRRLCDLVLNWTESGLAGNYVEQLREADDHGLLGWFLHGSGLSDPTFSRFRSKYPNDWTACQQEFR